MSSPVIRIPKTNETAKFQEPILNRLFMKQTDRALELNDAFGIVKGTQRLVASF